MSAPMVGQVFGSKQRPLDPSPNGNSGGCADACMPGGHAGLKSMWHQGLLQEVARTDQCFSPPYPFPPEPPKSFRGGLQDANMADMKFSTFSDGTGNVSSLDRMTLSVKRKKGDLGELAGLRVFDLGSNVYQLLLGALPLRSTPMGDRDRKDLFPLPTSESMLGRLLTQVEKPGIFWVQAMCVALNSMWGGCLHSNDEVGPEGTACLKRLEKEVLRFQGMSGRLEDFSWSDFFSTRSIDYKGDEVKTARSFSWDNIKHALPAEIGAVPLEAVCTLGAHHYVTHIDLYIKEPSSCVLAKAPRVMVPDHAWVEVCQGLVRSGVCTLLPVEEVFHTTQGPLLNGLFGVTKEEWVGDTEVFRLIMNLIPLNRLAFPLRGDVETLPMWSLMNPFFLQPGDNLLVSSEDVRCFFLHHVSS